MRVAQLFEYACLYERIRYFGSSILIGKSVLKATFTGFDCELQCIKNYYKRVIYNLYLMTCDFHEAEGFVIRSSEIWLVSNICSQLFALPHQANQDGFAAHIPRNLAFLVKVFILQLTSPTLPRWLAWELK